MRGSKYVIEGCQEDGTKTTTMDVARCGLADDVLGLRDGPHDAAPAAKRGQSVGICPGFGQLATPGPSAYSNGTKSLR